MDKLYYITLISFKFFFYIYLMLSFAFCIYYSAFISKGLFFVEEEHAIIHRIIHECLFFRRAASAKIFSVQCETGNSTKTSQLSFQFLMK